MQPRTTKKQVPGLQSLERAHGATHALTVADSALAAHLDLKDGLAARVVFDDCDVPELKAPRFIGSKAGVGGEKNIVVKLFRFPFVARRPRLLRTLAGGFVSFLYSSGENQARCEIFGDDLYGSERSGIRSSHPLRMAAFNVCRPSEPLKNSQL
ncbi:MAG TPA: hypothetical protein VKS22_14320 [Candidatus Binataceae bacterium]|nr:hypothetical protein [Candidatus Binataceae bacterium]